MGPHATIALLEMLADHYEVLEATEPDMSHPNPLGN